MKMLHRHHRAVHSRGRRIQDFCKTQQRQAVDQPDGRRRRFAAQRRTLWTHIADVPVHQQSPPERPCIVVLAEDALLYNKSWLDPFSALPSQHGMAMAQWQLTTTTMEMAVRELSDDLQAHDAHQIVLIARGPCVSWLAQFYLESLPLLGLLLIDPLPFDDQNAINQYELLHSKLTASRTPEYDVFQNSLQHHHVLRLERNGAVPVQVWQCLPRHTLGRVAAHVAHTYDCGFVNINQVRNFDVTSAVATWIVEDVL